MGNNDRILNETVNDRADSALYLVNVHCI